MALKKVYEGGVKLEREDVVVLLKEFADKAKWIMTNAECLDLSVKLMDLFENGPKLKKFRVSIPELHYRTVVVMARDRDEAIEKTDDVDDASSEYERTFDEHEHSWHVEEVRDG